MTLQKDDSTHHQVKGVDNSGKCSACRACNEIQGETETEIQIDRTTNRKTETERLRE